MSVILPPPIPLFTPITQCFSNILVWWSGRNFSIALGTGALFSLYLHGSEMNYISFYLFHLFSLIVKKDKFYRVSIIGSNCRIIIIFFSSFLITSADPNFKRHCSNPHPLHSLVFLMFIDTCLPSPKIDINITPKVNKMGKTSCGIRPIELTATRQNATIATKLCL